MKIRCVSLAAASLGITLMVGATTSAQAPAAASAATEAAATASSEPAPASTQTTAGRRGRHVHVSREVIVVPGERQRPYAFTVSGRRGLGYTYVDAPTRFTGEVVGAVRRTPF